MQAVETMIRLAATLAVAMLTRVGIGKLVSDLGMVPLAYDSWRWPVAQGPRMHKRMPTKVGHWFRQCEGSSWWIAQACGPCMGLAEDLSYAGGGRPP